MNLGELKERLSAFAETNKFSCIGSDTSVQIEGVSLDSRHVKTGYLFGLFKKNEELLPDALEAINNGCSGIVCTEAAREKIENSYSDLIREDFIWVLSKKPRLLFAKVVSRYFVHQPNHCVGVTGTNGKTSVVEFLRQIWECVNIKAASIGTLGVQSSTCKLDQSSNLTTPDSVTLHNTLRELKRTGIEHASLEMSSHGLDQYRADGVKFRAVAFTNFSRDHLDYHGTSEKYFDAKKRLFENILNPDGKAILNADINEYDDLVDICVQRNYTIFSYGYNGGYVKILNVTPHKEGIRIHFKIYDKEYKTNLQLMGSFQVSNVLCALAIAVAMYTDPYSTSLKSGFDPSMLIKSLENIKPIKGRMEHIGSNQNGGLIFLDYSHKPFALENAIKGLREHNPGGKINLVFGCGGDRDTHKREMMGHIANSLADNVFVTDDNPRGEDPALIRKSILSTCPKGIEIADRKEAISQGIQSLSSSNDYLLVAGKGHENKQIFKDHEIDFDDSSVIKDIIMQPLMTSAKEA
jgi:UDP-N-acetylmuramoyl-L-alanyl-D-glutamate--2,6-diaminopimelate ligase